MLRFYHHIVYLIEVRYVGYKPYIFILARQCRDCKHFLDLDCFQQALTMRDGLSGRCKDCLKPVRKANEEPRKERIREQQRDRSHTPAYREWNNTYNRKKYAEKKAAKEQELLHNPPPPRTSKVCPTCNIEKPLEEFRPNSDGYYSYCKECVREKANSEEAKAKRRAYMQQKRLDTEYREQLNRTRRIWWQENADTLNEKSRQKYATDPEYKKRLRKNTDKWHEENPLKRKEQNHRYQNRKRQNGYEPVDYEAIITRDNMFCYICQKPILPDQPYGFDHVIPVSRGGEHSYENIKLTHHVCNLRKANKLLNELSPYQRRGPD